MDDLDGRREVRPREYFNLVLAFVFVAAVWYGMHLRIAQPGDSLDQLIAATMSACCALSLVVQLVMTRVWTHRAVGLFLTLFGVAVYFGGIAYVGRTGDRSHNELLLDITRSLLIVGVPLLTIGLISGFLGWLLRGRPDEGF